MQVQLSALDPDVLPAAAEKVAAVLAKNPYIRDLDNGLPLPGIDWKIEVNKAEAAKYSAGPSTVGTAVQLVTNGVKVTEYRPSTSDKAVDILCDFRRTGAASTRSTNCGCRPSRLGADRKFRRARSNASGSATSTASAATG